jgi:polyisoprenoid-binding protein YceI
MLAVARVFTFKAGMLAKLAHDLRLRAERFEITLDKGKLNAWFDPDSLRVDGVMKANDLDPDVLSEQDKQRIHATIHDHVLDVTTYGRIEFTGDVRATDATQVGVRGTLRMHGREQPLELSARRSGAWLRAELSLTPSRFGIEPYKALGGAIRLRDDVRIELELELGELDLGALLEALEPVSFHPAPNPA